MTTKETAAEIRRELKRAGWNSRAVSVRTDYFSGGSSIDVTVRREGVPYSDVRRIALGRERIHRCEATGEILSGGNRYIHVRTSDDLRATVRERVSGPVEDALRRATDDRGLIVRVTDTVRLYWPSDTHDVWVQAVADGGKWIRGMRAWPSLESVIEVVVGLELMGPRR